MALIPSKSFDISSERRYFHNYYGVQWFPKRKLLAKKRKKDPRPSPSEAASSINANKKKSFTQPVKEEHVEGWYDKSKFGNFSLTGDAVIPIEFCKFLHNFICSLLVGSDSSAYEDSGDEMEVDKEEPESKAVGKGLLKTVSLLIFDPNRTVLSPEKVGF